MKRTKVCIIALIVLMLVCENHSIVSAGNESSVVNHVSTGIVDIELSEYQIKDGNWLDMISYPVLVLDVGEACNMDAAEKAVACECEEPEILDVNPYVIAYRCKNCGKIRRESRVHFAQKKNTNGNADEPDEMDFAQNRKTTIFR